MVNTGDDKEELQSSINSAFSLAAISGILPAFFELILAPLRDAQSRTLALPDIRLDEGKKLKDYDYYEPIRLEFVEIYKNLNKDNILEAFIQEDNTIDDIKKLKESIIGPIGPDNKEKKVEDFLKLLKILGFDFVESDLNDPSMFITTLLVQGSTKLGQNPKLSDWTKNLYFKELSSITKGVEEYEKIASKLKGITDPDLYNFTVQNLYLKTYELNKKVLKDVYKQITGKFVVDSKCVTCNKLLADFRDVQTYISTNNAILIEKMDSKLRVGIAHSIYKNMNKYPSNVILDMARRNFVTAVVGLIAKSDSIVSMFEKNSKFVTSILDRRELQLPTEAY